MHSNRNNRETVIIPQTIIVPTKSVMVAFLVWNKWRASKSIVALCILALESLIRLANSVGIL